MNSLLFIIKTWSDVLELSLRLERSVYVVLLAVSDNSPVIVAGLSAAELLSADKLCPLPSGLNRGPDWPVHR